MAFSIGVSVPAGRGKNDFRTAKDLSGRGCTGNPIEGEGNRPQQAVRNRLSRAYVHVLVLAIERI